MRVAVLGLLSLCALASVARADDAWRAPAGCPDRDDARAQLRALGGDPELLGDDVQVQITPTSTGELRARVTLRHDDRREQRVLLDRSCDALVEAALLVISLSFEGQRARPKPAALPKPRAPRSLWLAGLARLDVGSLPSPTLGIGGALRLQAGRFVGELEGAWYLPRTHARVVRGEFGLAAGAARGCVITAWRVFAPCVALELGQARGRATSTMRTFDARGLWAAALLGASFTLPWQRFAPIVDLELGVPFQRAAFDVEGAGTLFQARSIIARASLRLAFELSSRR